MGLPPVAPQAAKNLPSLDTRYVFDTNVWIDVSRGQIKCRDLRKKVGTGLLLSPLAITELVRGTIKGGESIFVRDKPMFKCMADGAPEILELPKPFVYKVIWNVDAVASGISGIRPRPQRYRELLEMLIDSKTLSEFLRRAEAPGSPWAKITYLDRIHESVLSRELNSLELLTSASPKALSVYVSHMYACGGLIPDPEFIEQRFSAALEYLRACVLKVRRGGKPWKNDRGSYVDLQFFWYLADPRIIFVTKEDFSDEIKASSQRTRIISYAAFSQ